MLAALYLRLLFVYPNLESYSLFTIQKIVTYPSIMYISSVNKDKKSTWADENPMWS